MRVRDARGEYSGRGTRLSHPASRWAKTPACCRATKYITPANGSPGMSPFWHASSWSASWWTSSRPVRRRASAAFNQIMPSRPRRAPSEERPATVGPISEISTLHSLQPVLAAPPGHGPRAEQRIQFDLDLAILAFCTVAFYQISERYGNPMALRSKRMGQKLVSNACGHGSAITTIFARAKSPLVGAWATPAPAPWHDALRLVKKGYTRVVVVG